MSTVLVKRHAVDQRVGHVDDLAFLDLGGGSLCHRRRDAIGGAGLVIWTEWRSLHESFAVALGVRGQLKAKQPDAGQPGKH